MSRTIKAGHVYRQYSTDGVYIADYKSSRAAFEATGVSLGSIARAAHGERKTGGGFLWRVVPEDSPKDPIEVDLTSRIGNHEKRPLIQLTADGQVVGEYLSIAHASRVLKISRRSLSCALSGAQKTAGGFRWVEKEVDKNEEQQ
ncbi:MAG: NUMOD1 domain-containing DNA-binding protein [Enterocloster sp.]